MKSSKQAEWHIVVLGTALLLGVLVRLMPLLLTGFPLNDGGMFYVMISDLLANDFRLPFFTTYNFADIPYAYPPLGFYVAALLKILVRMPEVESLRWLPFLANTGSIFAFYLVVSILVQDRPRAALAAAVYALTPTSYDWFIMGGGLSRSLGYLFLLLSLYFLVRTFRGGPLKFALLTSLFCALTILSHPEAALHAAASCALFWFFLGRSKRETLFAVGIGCAALALSSPWWISLLARHGPAPVLSAFHSGMYHPAALAALVYDILSRDTTIPVLLVLRLLGLGWAIWKKQFPLLAWMVLPYFTEPRSAPVVTFYSFNILIAFALADALPALVRRFGRRRAAAGLFHEIKWSNALILLLLGYLFVESALMSFRLVNTTLQPSVIEGMRWVRENTQADARFLLITGTLDPMVDPVQEWFPALAERRSQTTLQGSEWTLGGGFPARWRELSELQACEDAACIEGWSRTTGLDFTHILFQKDSFPAGLYSSLDRARYRLIYDDPMTVIYMRIR